MNGRLMDRLDRDTDGGLPPAKHDAVRRVLRAAAFTYVASSLAALLNLARWLAFLRRA